jgi:hypothetical protein
MFAAEPTNERCNIAATASVLVAKCMEECDEADAMGNDPIQAGQHTNHALSPSPGSWCSKQGAA